MKIYNYNKITKEYLYESIAIKDPLEDNRYLIPADSTTIKPLTNKDGKVVVYDEDDFKWKYEDDNRGKLSYNVNTKEEKIIDYLGKIDDNYTLLKPNQFDEWQNDRWVINKILEKERVALEYRKLRDSALKDVDFYQLALVYAELTAKQKKELKAYRLALLDSTKTQILPTKPDWFK